MPEPAPRFDAVKNAQRVAEKLNRKRDKELILKRKEQEEITKKKQSALEKRKIQNEAYQKHTKKGQPNMGSRITAILDKINKSNLKL